MKRQVKKSIWTIWSLCLKQFKEYIFTLKKRCRKCLPTWNSSVSGESKGEEAFTLSFFMFLWVFTRSFGLKYVTYISKIFFLNACWTRGGESRILALQPLGLSLEEGAVTDYCVTSRWWSVKPGLAEAGRSVGLPSTEPLSFPQGRPFLHPIGVFSFPQQGSFQSPCLKYFCWPKACHLENHSLCGLWCLKHFLCSALRNDKKYFMVGSLGDLRVGGHWWVPSEVLFSRNNSLSGIWTILRSLWILHTLTCYQGNSFPDMYVPKHIISNILECSHILLKYSFIATKIDF